MRLNGVVINADSLQVYAALPILTAQPSAKIQAVCPHRLYGYLPPDEALTAAGWASAARQEIEAAWGQGRLPILAGGSGLYLEALLEGLAVMPEIPAEFRRQAAAERERLGAEEFYRQLVGDDPLAARVHQSDTQRVLRAREVWLATGRSLYTWHAGAQNAWLDCLRIAVLPERAMLYEACNQRFMAMLATGAVEEVAAFRQQGVSSPVTRALGYAEIAHYLDGRLDRAAMISQAQAATRHYAKRQNTWFKNRFSLEDTYLVDSPVTEAEVDKLIKDLPQINHLC